MTRAIHMHLFNVIDDLLRINNYVLLWRLKTQLFEAGEIFSPLFLVIGFDVSWILVEQTEQQEKSMDCWRYIENKDSLDFTAREILMREVWVAYVVE